ncbi:MAG TPA: 5'-3' exonuclease H3TH domain-containing protein [Acidimicrobiales bacterium]|jgi:5'-3' exonuclease|nr:5'-3' exonuclease H3TH domain-containing protein [Acidimicrobiales bacterium]
MRAYLIDGTYELFRYHFAVPAEVRAKGAKGAATRGVLGSILGMLEEGATHLGVATDHVIESFRNDLYPGYKTGEGVDPDLKAQFPLIEAVLQAMGVTVWPMVELEADDALASAAAVLTEDERVLQVVICTPDKDLGQCVVGDRVVQLDRRKGIVLDEAGVTAKFGVPPTSIPDYLALVGDSADGFPGLKGWGAKAAAGVLKRYLHIEDIPRLAERWDVDVRGARTLANCLHDHYDDALLFKELATLRIDRDLCPSLESLRWAGPPDPAAFAEACEHLGAPGLPARVERLAVKRRPS